ncbi:anhydro-N-acetylmuramic acid kinase [Acidipila sp. EB88]|uniref:anhydro-N-acetylmuramic acid kinase n=1 Tax=Acidipila sp. EB88 TaxID=2305226 RepID=UPI000F5E2855|nr:anhydro-N-acetylmuramic acid kinase [Acidipila sp. EB88]RRA49438.1 anhydro-N-acetylmuramic acid kinase [Acidipila sp. EB88]
MSIVPPPAPASRRRRPTPLTVAGIMSGTSADGIDIAVVRITPRPRAASPRIELLAHRGYPFPGALRAAVLAAQDAQRTSTAELAHLNWRLGVAYAQCYQKTAAAYAAPIDLVGCHGQTIYHQGAVETYAGARFRCTWQIGEMALLAQAAGVPVVSNFRPADMVAGGQGAPLVPLLDQALYRDARRTRVLQNIGGIGNLTVVPPASSTAPVIAFDTGPGNMVMDALMQQLYSKAFDRGGRIAASGNVLEPVITATLRDRFFREPPPRSAGREQFGERFAKEFLRSCRQHSRLPADAVATATALTVHSIERALQQFATAPDTDTPLDLLVSGGGARNGTLMHMLRTRLTSRSVRVLATSDPSLPSPMPVEAKEAAAFALLAYNSWHGLPGNIASATGAATQVVLGQVTCA